MLGLPNPYLIGGVALAFAATIGFGIWEKHEAKVAREGQAVAERQAALSAADAERWQAASNLRDGAITDLTSKLNEQSALIQAGEAKASDLRKSLDSARLQNERLSSDHDELTRELAEEAAKAPGDVREIGPIVKRRVQHLFDKDTPPGV